MALVKDMIENALAKTVRPTPRIGARSELTGLDDIMKGFNLPKGAAATSS